MALGTLAWIALQLGVAEPPVRAELEPPRPPAPAPPPVYVDASASLVGITWDGGATEFELADTNGDGHLDVLSVGDHGNPLIGSNQQGVITFFGDGRGGFTLVQGGNFGYGGLAVGDVNGDGWLDVGYGIHHDYSGTDLGDQLLEVALGDGTGTSWTPWDDGLATNGETWGMFATDFADVDADGRLDVLSNSFGCCAGAHVYRNQGDGTWEQSFGFLGGNATADAVFGDVDGDGDPDFAVGNSTGSVWLGDGAGGFANVDGNLPGTASSRRSFDFGDVDGDGRDELAFVSGGSLEVWSHADGSVWQERSANLPTSSPAQRLQLADMDGDGHLDVVAVGGGTLVVFRGDGGTSWTVANVTELAGAGFVEALRVDGDLDHNGRPDVLVLQDESCGLFCSRNRLYLLREASPPTSPTVRLTAPGDRTTWRAGSVRRVDWTSSVPAGVPATVDVELSLTGPDGPWTTLASDVPNDGQQQVLVPNVATTNAFVRVTVTTPAEMLRARHRLPVRIVP